METLLCDVGNTDEVQKAMKRIESLSGKIASTRALMSEPDGEAYGASKGGIVALTHALAISLGPKTRVNCVSPGWIEVNDYKNLSEERILNMCKNCQILFELLKNAAHWK